MKNSQSSYAMQEVEKVQEILNSLKDFDRLGRFQYGKLKKELFGQWLLWLFDEEQERTRNKERELLLVFSVYALLPVVQEQKEKFFTSEAEQPLADFLLDWYYEIQDNEPPADTKGKKMLFDATVLHLIDEASGAGTTSVQKAIQQIEAAKTAWDIQNRLSVWGYLKILYDYIKTNERYKILQRFNKFLSLATESLGAELSRQENARWIFAPKGLL